jgi:hypothetical protein
MQFARCHCNGSYLDLAMLLLAVCRILFFCCWKTCYSPGTERGDGLRRDQPAGRACGGRRGLLPGARAIGITEAPRQSSCISSSAELRTKAHRRAKRRISEVQPDLRESLMIIVPPTVRSRCAGLYRMHVQPMAGFVARTYKTEIENNHRRHSRARVSARIVCQRMVSPEDSCRRCLG